MTEVPACKAHMDSLRDKLGITKFKKALALLPKGAGSNTVDLAYEEALNRVNTQLAGQRDLARRILILIAYAYEPTWSILQLQEALSSKPESIEFDNEATPEIEDLADHCAGLVVIDEQRRVGSTCPLHLLQEYLDRTLDENFLKGTGVSQTFA